MNMNIVCDAKFRQLYVLIKFPVRFDWFFLRVQLYYLSEYISIEDCFRNVVQHITYTDIDVQINYLSIRTSRRTLRIIRFKQWNEIDIKYDTNDHESNYYGFSKWRGVRTIFFSLHLLLLLFGDFFYVVETSYDSFFFSYFS